MFDIYNHIYIYTHYEMMMGKRKILCDDADVAIKVEEIHKVFFKEKYSRILN